MKKRIITLFSGSSGNVTYLQYGETEILIDMGVSCRAVCAALRAVGSEPERIRAVFVTHEHIDHTRGLDVFTKKYPVPVHIVADCADFLPYEAGEALRSCMHRHGILYRESVGDLLVTSFAASHDSRCCVGYRIEGAGQAFYSHCTDTGIITDGAREKMMGSEYALLECNHDEQMLMMGPYPYELKCRVCSTRGHLSNDACAAFAKELKAGGTKGLMLAHLSKENNVPALAEITVRNAVGPELKLICAASDEPTVLIDEE